MKIYGKCNMFSLHTKYITWIPFFYFLQYHRTNNNRTNEWAEVFFFFVRTYWFAVIDSNPNEEWIINGMVGRSQWHFPSRLHNILWLNWSWLIKSGEYFWNIFSNTAIQSKKAKSETNKKRWNEKGSCAFYTNQKFFFIII